MGLFGFGKKNDTSQSMPPWAEAPAEEIAPPEGPAPAAEIGLSAEIKDAVSERKNTALEKTLGMLQDVVAQLDANAKNLPDDNLAPFLAEGLTPEEVRAMIVAASIEKVGGMDEKWASDDPLATFLKTTAVHRYYNIPLDRVEVLYKVGKTVV
ncbi:MAG: hypothetical protein LBS85_04270 [Clostridiales Family XIII bacterium]|jgi:hypothetical protein|nr:hypothetical protein [Clostridiales Family XIII bacterium]